MARIGAAVAIPKVPKANGGTTYPAGKKVPKATTSASLTPPAFTFDPAIAAKAREAKLSEEEQQREIETKQHFDQTDFHNALHQLHTGNKRELQGVAKKQSRGEEDLDRESGRGEEKIGNEEADTQKNAARQQEDFGTKRTEIARQFGELAHRQSESQNASGTLDQGTSAAAAAARARNQQISEAPISTAEGRLNEDLTEALGRYATARGQLGEDTSREQSRLGEDTSTSKAQIGQNQAWEKHKAAQELARQKFGLGRKSEELKVAGVNAQQNSLEEEIYQAMEEHPAAFKKWAEEHPNALPSGVSPTGAAAKAPTGAGAKVKKPGAGVSTNGGVSAPGGNKKRRR